LLGVDSNLVETGEIVVIGGVLQCLLLRGQKKARDKKRERGEKKHKIKFNAASDLQRVNLSKFPNLGVRDKGILSRGSAEAEKRYGRIRGKERLGNSCPSPVQIKKGNGMG